MLVLKKSSNFNFNSNSHLSSAFSPSLSFSRSQAFSSPQNGRSVSSWTNFCKTDNKRTFRMEMGGFVCEDAERGALSDGELCKISSSARWEILWDSKLCEMGCSAKWGVLQNGRLYANWKIYVRSKSKTEESAALPRFRRVAKIYC